MMETINNINAMNNLYNHENGAYSPDSVYAVNNANPENKASPTCSFNAENKIFCVSFIMKNVKRMKTAKEMNGTENMQHNNEDEPRYIRAARVTQVFWFTVREIAIHFAHSVSANPKVMEYTVYEMDADLAVEYDRSVKAGGTRQIEYWKRGQRGSDSNSQSSG